MKAEGMIEDYKRVLLTTFFVQKRIIYTAAAVIFISAVLVSFLWPKTYAAYGSILVKGKKSDKSPSAIEREEIRPHPVTKEDLNSESEILISPDVIKSTILWMRDNKKYKQPRSMLSSLTGMLSKSKASDNDKTVAESEIYTIRKSITTVIVPTTNVIKITLTDNNPQYAVDLLNALMDQFLAYRSQIYNPEGTKSFFLQQVTDTRAAIEGKEDELLKLYKEGEGIMPAKEIENNLALKKDLEQDLHYLKQNAMEKKHLIEYVENALKDKELSYFSFIEGNDAITNLSKALQELVAEGGPIVTRYSPDSEKVKLFNEQVTNMSKALRREVEGYVNNVRRQLNTTNDKIDSVERRIDKINAQDIKLQELLIATERVKRDIEISKASYDIFSKRKEESRISSSSEAGNFLISTMGKAFPSSGPIFPIPGLLIPIGLVAGAMTGMTLGFLKEYMDQTFKSPEDVVKYAHLPVLLFIPFMTDAPAQSDKGAAPPSAKSFGEGGVSADTSVSDMFTTLKSYIRIFKDWFVTTRTVYMRGIVLLCMTVVLTGTQVAASYSTEIINMMDSASKALHINISQSSAASGSLNAEAATQPKTAVAAPAASAPQSTAKGSADTKTSGMRTAPLQETEKRNSADVPGSRKTISHKTVPSVKVKVNTAKLHTMPSPRAIIVAYPQKGDKIVVLETYGKDWLKVKTADDTEGWISALVVGTKAETAGL
ncbi:Wzz/FepE/Etk N-terminal domain-containing protein [Candidatus Magnetominusculus xianensis]|uniref:LPS biosynthesis protein n=1 Tax=Candidatus Magnetominusculus xianensis TaxID=1748249 RepID=A0ABR5SDG2_9BACT|nr:Wzz/FepE/Etk N-terminal domain-containing protein [Candidatus Magnetominusculus xianensis]KWT82981.1 LPS biosynthesis protein [Candidatus Magnetominusculus xianensis]MBF0403060.1 SH3 domain-containing protein [Nitrospirota bacterium]